MDKPFTTVTKSIRELVLNPLLMSTNDIINFVNLAAFADLKYSGCELNEADNSLITYIYTDGDLTVEVTKNNKLISETTLVKICIENIVVRFWAINS